MTKSAVHPQPAERTATPAQNMVSVCCENELRGGQKGIESAEGALKSVISKTGLSAHFKRSSQVIHRALGGQQWAADVKGVKDEDVRLQRAGVFVTRNSGTIASTPLERYHYAVNSKFETLPAKDEDWIVAEQYWNCIDQETWENEACPGGKLRQEVKEKRSHGKAVYELEGPAAAAAVIKKGDKDSEEVKEKICKKWIRDECDATNSSNCPLGCLHYGGKGEEEERFGRISFVCRALMKEQHRPTEAKMREKAKVTRDN
eukprot:g13309.t1